MNANVHCVISLVVAAAVVQKKGSEQRAKRLQRQKRKLRGTSQPSANTIGFIIRTHDARHAHTHIKSLLRQFRLNKKYDGTFIQLNEATLEALKPIDPYVVYGHVSSPHRGFENTLCWLVMPNG